MDSWSSRAFGIRVLEHRLHAHSPLPGRQSFLTLAGGCDHLPPFVFIDTSLSTIWALPKKKKKKVLLIGQETPLPSRPLKLLNVKEIKRCLSLFQHRWARNEIREETGGRGPWGLKTDASKRNWDFFRNLYTHNYTWSQLKLKKKQTIALCLEILGSLESWGHW